MNLTLKNKLNMSRGTGQVLTVTAGLVFLCIVFGIINPNFFSGRNISNLLRQIAPILIIGIGQSYVLITGNIDLSIGSVVGMSTMISATLMTKGMNPWIAVLITLVCCMTIGIINGYLVEKFKIPPFIATLGTMTVARGIAQIVNNNYNTNSIDEGAQNFRNFFLNVLFKLLSLPKAPVPCDKIVSVSFSDLAQENCTVPII